MTEKLTKKAMKEMDENTLYALAVEHGYEGEQDDAKSSDLIDFIYDKQKPPGKDEDGDEPELPEEKVIRGRKNYPGFSGKRKRIKISEGARGEPSYVFVGINGDYEAQIPRGIEVVVPEEVVENLMNGAIETHTDTDDSGRPIGRDREVSRFSVQVLGDA